MASAPEAADEILTPHDVTKVLEELLPVQTKSYVLGLKLNLPQHEVEAIYSTYHEPADRLLHIIIKFLKLAEPRPTWRVIVEALRSPAVNLPALAKEVESAHFPDPPATREVVPENTGMKYHQ